MLILKASGQYFALVFGAGFALGVFRTLWIVPLIGDRMAELIELPVMIAISAIVARWIARRLSVPPTLSCRITMGATALLLTLSAELTMMVWLRGISIREYIAGRDVVAGSAYCVSLLLFAFMPLLARWR